MEKIYRVQMNAKGMPNFATAVEVEPIKTKEVKYFDSEEGVWTIGEVIVDKIEQKTEMMPELKNIGDVFKMFCDKTDTGWK